MNEARKAGRLRDAFIGLLLAVFISFSFAAHAQLADEAASAPLVTSEAQSAALALAATLSDGASIKPGPVALPGLQPARVGKTSAPADLAGGGIEVRIGTPGSQSGSQVTNTLKIVLGLTLLAMAPGLIIVTTCFTRIVVVFSMLRHALGLQDTPPNTVLVSLAMFLTFAIMSPVIEQINADAIEPLSKDRITLTEAVRRGAMPLKEFMLRQTREQDLSLMAEIANAKPPQSVEEVSFAQLAPAYLLSELKSAFQIGFLIFLPFLIIDLVVSSILMAMGMMMVPPAVLSLPFKILLFVMIDGWNLIVRALSSSFF